MKVLNKMLIIIGLVSNLFALQDGIYVCFVNKIVYSDNMYKKFSVDEAIKQKLVTKLTLKGNTIIFAEDKYYYDISGKGIDIFATKNGKNTIAVPEGIVKLKNNKLFEIALYTSDSNTTILLSCFSGKGRIK